jgi:hypothetical protein
VVWSSEDAAISSDVIVVRSPYVLLAISVDVIAGTSTADVALWPPVNVEVLASLLEVSMPVTGVVLCSIKELEFGVIVV